MFDLGWWEMMVIALIAIIVIGPKELPQVLRGIGRWTRKAQRMAGDFRAHVDDMVRDTDLGDVHEQVKRIGNTDLRREIEKAIDADGIKKAIDADGIEKSLRLESAEKPAEPDLDPTEGSSLPSPAVQSEPGAKPLPADEKRQQEQQQQAAEK